VRFLEGLFGLDGRVALVTGSSAGIGRALAEGLAAAGARVVINGRDRAKVDAAVAALEAKGHAASGAVFDVTDEAAVEAGIAAIEAEVGPIEILVNNAGMQHRGALESFPTEAFDRLMATNVRSAFLVGRAVAQRMIPRGRGKIINIASVQSELARKGIAPYTATKGAVKNLTKGMATDWGPHGLTVNAIAPGYFKTDLNKALSEDAAFSGWLAGRTPMGRWGDVEELVGAAIYLAAPASSFVNGHTLIVDGGITACL
jgi:gluconate 5-dehydrogenase